jgi:hypothetical protein
MGAGTFLCFHFLLQQAGSFFLQTDIHGAVANQVTVAAGAAKCLKQNVLLSARTHARPPCPKTSQCTQRCPQLARCEVDRKKWQDQVKAVGIAA